VSSVDQSKHSSPAILFLPVDDKSRFKALPAGKETKETIEYDRCHKSPGTKAA